MRILPNSVFFGFWRRIFGLRGGVGVRAMLGLFLERHEHAFDIADVVEYSKRHVERFLLRRDGRDGQDHMGRREQGRCDASQ
jgi:hypothetical protein